MNPGLDQRDDCGHAYSRYTSASGQIEALSKPMMGPAEIATTDTRESLDDLFSKLHQLNSPNKVQLSEREIQKTMRMRGLK